MSVLTQSDPRTYQIIGAAMEVHRQLGCGFAEPVYQGAMAVELATRSIPFQAQREFPIIYKGKRLDAYYKPDFICFDEVVVELKALGRLTSVEEAQVINYLKVTRFEIGLLINFGGRSLEQRRFVLSTSGHPQISPITQIIKC
jgi:GxxExxY protein